MAASFDELLLAHGPSGAPLRGVGTGIPGPVDPASGRVVYPSRMPGWNNFPVAEYLDTRYDLPILVENDANLMAVGEARAWPGCDNLMVLKAGSGIGCGVIVNGRLHRGRGAAGDISHVRVTDRLLRHVLLRPPRLPGGLRERRRPDGAPWPSRASPYGGPPISSPSSTTGCPRPPPWSETRDA